MKYKRFEDLPVWQAAISLGLQIDALTDDRAFDRRGDFRSQIRRAVLSVSNNIAEGFELGTTQQLITFLYTARGSAGEVRSMLSFAERAAWAAHLKSDISNLKSLAESCSRQLRAWAEQLQNSEIRGTRYLNEASRSAFDRRQRMSDFVEKLQKVREGATVDSVFGDATPEA